MRQALPARATGRGAPRLPSSPLPASLALRRGASWLLRRSCWDEERAGDACGEQEAFGVCVRSRKGGSFPPRRCLGSGRDCGRRYMWVRRARASAWAGCTRAPGRGSCSRRPPQPLSRQPSLAAEVCCCPPTAQGATAGGRAAEGGAVDAGPGSLRERTCLPGVGLGG